MGPASRSAAMCPGVQGGGGAQLNVMFYPFWHELTPFFVPLRLFWRLEIRAWVWWGGGTWGKLAEVLRCAPVFQGWGHISIVFVPFLAWILSPFCAFLAHFQARKRQLEQRLGEGGVLLLVLDLTTWDQLAEVLPRVTFTLYFAFLAWN